MTDRQKGYIFIAGSTFFAAITFLLVDFVFRNFDIGLIDAIFAGWIGATLFLTPFFLFPSSTRRKLTISLKKDFKVLILVSSFTTIGAIFWLWAMFESSSGLVALINESKILWTFLFGVVFLRERIFKIEIVGILISIIGFLMIATLKKEISFLALTLTLVQAFLYALQSFCIKKYAPGIDGISFAFARMVLMTSCFGIFLALLDKINTVPLMAFLILSVAQIFGFFLSRALYFQAHNYLPISKLNFFLLATPVFVLIGAFLIFDDAISFQKSIGVILILGGLGLFLKKQKHSAN